MKKQIIELWDDSNTLQYYDGYLIVGSGIHMIGFDFSELSIEEYQELIIEMQKHLDKRKSEE